MPKHTFKPLAAVIGHPVSHSLSPAIFRTLGVTSYDALDILPEELVAFTNRLRTEDWVGCNVTLPHKQNVIPCLDLLTSEAQDAGAVNVIEVRRPKSGGRARLVGHNTDIYGILQTFKENGVNLRGRRGPSGQNGRNGRNNRNGRNGRNGKTAIIFGAGGAARAVASALARAGAGEVHVWARRRSQAYALVRHCAEHLAIRFPNTRFKVLARVPESSADIYINATPLGMKGFKTNRLLPKQVRRGAWAFDLVYRPEDTSFLRQAKKRNLNCIGGLDMLIWQALATRKIWFRQQSEPYVKIKLKRRLRSIISGKRS